MFFTPVKYYLCNFFSIRKNLGKCAHKYDVIFCEMPQNTFLAVHAGVSRNVSFTESVCMDAVCSSENVIEAVKVSFRSSL